MLESFHQTLGRHCSCTLSVNLEFQSFVSVVFRQCLVIDHQCTLARCARPLLLDQSTACSLGRAQVSVAASIADAGSFCGGGQREPAPARYAVRRRPTPPSPPRGLMHASAHRSTVAVARQAQGTPSAADGPVPPRSVETTQERLIQPSLASKRDPWTSTLMPNPQNYPTKHCAAVTIVGDPRSRPPPRIAYKMESRARSQERTTSTPHQNPAKPLGGPRGGLLPQLRPPRSASATSSIHSCEATLAAQTSSVASSGT